MGIKHSLVTKISSVVMVFLLVMNLLSSWWVYGQIKNDAHLQIERQIKGTLYGISANIDGDEFQKLLESGKTGNVYYEALNSYLNRCLINGDFKYLYTVAKQEKGEFIYCVDAAKPIDADFVDFGTPLDITADVGTQVVDRALKEGIAFTKIQYFEEWGNLLTGYVAIYNSQHQPVGLLAIDLIASDYYQRVNHLSQVVWITLGIASIATGLLLISALIRSLKPLKQIQKAVQVVAKGNLGEQIRVHRKDEIGGIAQAINLMAEQLGDTIKVIRGCGQKLLEAAGYLVSQSEVVREASKRVSIEALDIRTQSEVDQQNLLETKEKMNRMQSHVVAIQGKSEEVLGEVKGSYEYALKGNQGVTQTTQTISAMTKTIREANEEVGQLRQHIGEAMKLVDLIAKIANKSKILGLNAAIESTKQDGRGFEVVAKEIGGLAKESSLVAAQTKEILEGIERESQQTEQKMNETWEQMKLIEENAHEMEQYFGEILVSNKRIKGRTEEVSESIGQYTREAARVLEQMKEAEKHAVNLMDNCQNIVAFTQEQFATAEQLLEYAIALKALSQTLEKSVGVFQTK